MTKDQVIYMKNVLKTDKKFAIIATLANGADVIDETDITGFVYWDDNNGYAYDFELTNSVYESSYQALDKHVNVKMVPYDEITSMKAVGIPVADIDTIISSVGITGTQAAYIKHLYEALVNPKFANLSRTRLNEIIGVNMANTEYDYDNGNWHKPFKETVETDRYNESIKKHVDEYNEKYKDKNIQLVNTDGYTDN